MKQEEMLKRISGLYPDAQVTINGEDCNFEMTVVTQKFEGLGLLQRQKSILALFKDEITSGELHALSVKTRTPQEN